MCRLRIVFIIGTSWQPKIDVSAARETRLWNSNWRSTRKKIFKEFSASGMFWLRTKSKWWSGASPFASHKMHKRDSCRWPWKQRLIAREILYMRYIGDKWTKTKERGSYAKLRLTLLFPTPSHSRRCLQWVTSRK